MQGLLVFPRRARRSESNKWRPAFQVNPSSCLQGVEFNLQAGDGLGVIGPSGSGKTSLARALVGIWPILKGSVRLDGSTLDQWVDSERGNFVSATSRRMSNSSMARWLRISAGFNQILNLVDIIRASKLASIHQMVAGLPDGYNTVVGDSGARLSAGQRQRVSDWLAPFMAIRFSWFWTSRTRTSTSRVRRP